MKPTEANENKPTRSNRKQWQPPRGIRIYTIPERPDQPFAVMWRVDGKRKVKTFPTAEKQLDWAKGLAGGVEAVGIDAYRLNPDEARAWRAFRAQVAPAGLEEVLACWERHGKPQANPTAVPVAVERFLAAKETEGIDSASIGHYRVILDRFGATTGAMRMSAVSRDFISAYVAAIPGADYTRLTVLKRIRTLFHWAKDNGYVAASPCTGLKGVKIVRDEVEIITLDQARSLFAKNERTSETNPNARELCGRLALEAFCGIRYETAKQAVAAWLNVEARGIRIPADMIKTRRAEYLQGMPDNLWRWIEWSQPETWKMTPRQYLEEKSTAFVRADIPHPRNALRHSFGTYHVAAYGDIGKTATIMCHQSIAMTKAHYAGIATKSDGLAYFGILPS